MMFYNIWKVIGTEISVIALISSLIIFENWNEVHEHQESFARWIHTINFKILSFPTIRYYSVTNIIYYSNMMFHLESNTFPIGNSFDMLPDHFWLKYTPRGCSSLDFRVLINNFYLVSISKEKKSLYENYTSKFYIWYHFWNLRNLIFLIWTRYSGIPKLLQDAISCMFLIIYNGLPLLITR